MIKSLQVNKIVIAFLQVSVEESEVQVITVSLDLYFKMFTMDSKV